MAVDYIVYNLYALDNIQCTAVQELPANSLIGAASGLSRISFKNKDSLQTSLVVSLRLSKKKRSKSEEPGGVPQQ